MENARSALPGIPPQTGYPEFTNSIPLLIAGPAPSNEPSARFNAVDCLVVTDGVEVPQDRAILRGVRVGHYQLLQLNVLRRGLLHVGGSLRQAHSFK
jgi:hypothetical protein